VVGIFVIIAVCALGWLIFQFRDLPGFITERGSFTVKVQFPTAPGVAKDTEVRLCGYQVGRVKKVEPPKVLKDLNKDTSYHQTVVVLNIKNEFKNIPANVNVKLIKAGLGSSYIELEVPPPDANQPVTEFLVQGSRLQGSVSTGGEFFPEETQKKLNTLFDRLNLLAKNANEVIGDPNNKENFKSILANVAKVSEQTKQTAEEARKALEQAKQMMDEATQTIAEFRKFAEAGTKTLKNTDTKAGQLVTAMVQTSEQLSQAASQMRLLLQKINSGQGSAARFLNDGKLYENLLENTQQFEVLLNELISFMQKANAQGKLPVKL